MPKLVGAMKLKNEEIFIEKVVGQIVKYVDALVVVDDWSEDKTIEILQDVCSKAKIPVKIKKSPHEKYYHEHSDGNLELEMVREFKADWCIQIDGDDIYEAEFIKKLPEFMNFKEIDVVYTGATHMWSIQDKNWWEVDEFRIDDGWVNFWTRDKKIGFQHSRPALFKIYPYMKKCGYARDHGYLCPSEIFNGKSPGKKYHPDYVFCHYGYSTPKLVEKKCERHGSIPPLTSEETQKGILYPPEYRPDGFTPEINISTFKNAWLKKEGVQLRKFPRQIWV